MRDPFDDLAATYDGTFTDTFLGRMLRDAVWRRADVLFPAGREVLEINGGTGVDAVYLAQRGVRVHLTDASPEMVRRARDRIEAAGLGHLVDSEVMRIEDTLATVGSRRYDGVLSNFGGLNCVADLGSTAAQLAAVTRPGAMVLATIMGPAVPWEWLWFGVRGDWRSAWRRRTPGGVEWRGRRVRYPSARRVRRDFGTWFRTRRVWAMGALVPPTYAGAWAERHPRLVRRLNRVERALEAVPPLARLADHFVIELERRSG